MLEDSKPQGVKTENEKETLTDPESTTTLEPPFATPEQAAKQDEILGTETPEPEVMTKKKRRFPPKLTKKQWIIVGIISAFVLAAGGAGLYMLLRKKPAAQPAAVTETKKEPPKPTTVPSCLTGVQISPKLNDLPTTGVMIENSDEARPQSGLLDAGVVFEAIAEGGITRFLVLYQEAQPTYIGPVRSVRPYYLDFLVPFDAPIAHAGGSGEALAQIQAQGIKDLDEFANGSAYERITERYRPHNLYTSRAKLLELQRSKGYSKSDFKCFVRKAEKKAKKPSVTSIDLQMSGPIYNVHYDYSATTNSYSRSVGGARHTDEKTKTQLHPKVVIALVMPYSQNGIYSIYQTNGSGKAYIFQDGGLTEGKWSKGSRKDQLQFKDAAGKTLGLNPGQTWITLIKSNADVQIKP